MPDKCKNSHLQASIKVLQLETQIEHTGTLVHSCCLDKKHTEKLCKCICGAQWTKFHNEN